MADAAPYQQIGLEGPAPKKYLTEEEVRALVSEGQRNFEREIKASGGFVGWSRVTDDDGTRPSDGATVIYYQAAAPATGLNTGDYWIDSDDNMMYIWDGDSWNEIQDDDVTTALSTAASAQSTADGKVYVWAQAAAPTADAVGDIWIETDNDNKYYRWDGDSWESVRDPVGNWTDLVDDDGHKPDADATVGAVAGTNLKDSALTTLNDNDIKNSAVVRITTFYQTGIPTSLHAGDLWVDTDDGNKLYRATIVGSNEIKAGEWVAVQDAGIATAIADAADAQSTADGKIVTFYATSAPTADGTGDLWFDTDDDMKPYRWSGASWQAVRDTVANWSDVVDDDSNKPDNNATVGATTGTNLYDSGAVTLGDYDVKNIASVTAGETINGGTLPVPVYVNPSDNEFYKCDGNDTSKLEFAGFAISNGTDGNSMKVQFAAIVPGFSSLTEGEVYYVQDTAGTIGTTPGTYPVPVGIAVSVSAIAIWQGFPGITKYIVAGSTTAISATTENDNTSDSWTKIKEAIVGYGGSVNTSFEIKTGGSYVAYGRIYINGVAVGTEHNNGTTTYQEKTDSDLTVAPGDRIQLYSRIGSGGFHCYVRNFYIKYDIYTIGDYRVTLDS